MPPSALLSVATIALHPDQFTGGLSRLDLLIRKPRKHGRQPLQGFQLFGGPVRLIALGEFAHKEAIAPNSEHEDCPKPTRLAVAIVDDPLLEHATAAIGIVQARHHVMCGLEQLSIGQADLLTNRRNSLVT